MPANSGPDSGQTTPSSSDSADLTRHVRDALAHLYDVDHLQTSPLTRILKLETESGAASRGQALRRLLLDTIELMRPDKQVPYGDRAWRPYRASVCRYVLRMSAIETQEDIGISERQLHREHARGLRILVNHLSQKTREALVGERESGRVSETSSEDPYDVAVQRFLKGTADEQLYLSELMQSVVDDLSGLANRRGVSMRLACEPGLGSLYANRSALRQVLLGMLSHVLSSANDQALRISLRTDEQAATVSMTLIDSARMAQDAMEGEAGLPQRLARVARLVDCIGGKLLTDARGVELVLPLNPKIIMVVDDNRDMVDLLERFLADSQYRLVGVCSGQDALHQAPLLSPYLILLDVMMPDQDGWEVLQRLKHGTATAHLPVVVCSILSEPELALSLGADAYLQKPVTQQALLTLLDDIGGSVHVETGPAASSAPSDQALFSPDCGDPINDPSPSCW